MKGMILAAGEGKRLRPLTEDMPKPMLPLAGRPLLEHIINHLRDCGVNDLAINLHHLPDAVMDYFGDGSQWGVSLRYSVEDSLLGSAGGVKRLQSFFDDTFLVYYGDVFTQADLGPMISLHRCGQVLATMALYQVPDPWNRGIVALDDQQIITRFVEKPARDRVFSDLANAGIYVLEPDVFNWIPVGQTWDFGHDVFPTLLAEATRVAGYIIKDNLIDIGQLEKYEQANRLASQQLGSAHLIKPFIAEGVTS
jgi:NDP-sugar pyrophosphorylase family protein